MPDQSSQEKENINLNIEEQPKEEVQPEQPVIPEQAVEEPQGVVTPLEKIKEGTEAGAPAVSTESISIQKATHEDETHKEIEKVLEADLKPIYDKMNLEQKEKFKKEGEEAVEEIEGILKQAKVHIKKILSIIIKWLKIIPGVKKFFLEKVAMEKTREILKIKKEKEVADDVNTNEDKNNDLEIK